MAKFRATGRSPVIIPRTRFSAIPLSTNFLGVSNDTPPQLLPLVNLLSKELMAFKADEYGKCNLLGAPVPNNNFSSRTGLRLIRFRPPLQFKHKQKGLRKPLVITSTSNNLSYATPRAGLRLIRFRHPSTGQSRQKRLRLPSQNLLSS